MQALRELRAERNRRQGLVVSVPPRTVVIEPREAASAVDAGASADLVEKLRSVLLGEDVRERLKAYLETGDDPDLAAALGEISGIPVQQAFSLLMS